MIVNDEIEKVGFAVTLDRHADRSHPDADEFASHWNNLPVDSFMADGGSYRLRRYSRFLVTSDDGRHVPLPHRAYGQSSAINEFAGDTVRLFDPLENSLVCLELFAALIQGDLFKMPNEMRKEAEQWHLDVHQIRIRADAGESGSPAPEGPHQDGLTFIVTRLVNLENADGGESAVLDLDRRTLWEGCLTQPFDCYYADDRRVMHDATAIRPANQKLPAYRDVLLFGFRFCLTAQMFGA